MIYMCMVKGSILEFVTRSEGTSDSSYVMVLVVKWATTCVSAYGLEWSEGLWYKSLFDKKSSFSNDYGSMWVPISSLETYDFFFGFLQF